MKQLTYLVTLALILIACETNSYQNKNAVKKPQTYSMPKAAIDSMQKTIGSMQKFKSILNGFWYQASYIDSIQQTKSPFLSRNSLAAFVELYIDTTEVTGDSLEIGAPGIHEGTSFMVYFKPGLTPTSLPTNIVDYDTASNISELGYNISNGDTSLVLSTYNKDKKIIYQTQYLKAPKNSEEPLQYMVNKALFAGSYKAEESSGQISILKFSNDGRLYGLPNYKKYYVLTDFVAESDNSVDQVCFDLQTDNQRCYGFAIQADTIKLYDLKESMDTTQFGELKYKLVKQR
ncbi:MAG TPA: hypothetical protein VFT78_09710 [Hanamia sp.]|nr:hypothetical protein [Hanamia sp.]